MAVYVVGPEGDSGPGPYKIGYTGGPGEKRLASLQTGSPVGLHIVLWFSISGRGVETRLHRFFNGKRVRGEWFDLNLYDLLFLKACYEADVLANDGFIAAMQVYVRQEMASGDLDRQMSVGALVLGWGDKL